MGIGVAEIYETAGVNVYKGFRVIFKGICQISANYQRKNLRNGWSQCLQGFSGYFREHLPNFSQLSTQKSAKF